MTRKILKFLAQTLLAAGLITLSLHTIAFVGSHLALAASPLTLPDGSKYGSIPTPAVGKTGQDVLAAGIVKAIGYAKILVGMVSVAIIIFMGVKMVVAAGEEETVKKATTGLLYSLVAFAIISMSEEIGQLVGFFKEGASITTAKSNGGIIGSADQMVERVHLFDKQVEILMTFIKYMIGSLAVASIVMNGVKLVAGGGEDENVKKAKNGIIYSLVGLVLLVVANTFVNNVFYKIDKSTYSGLEGVKPQTDLQAGVAEIVGITNFIVSFMGPVLVLLIIVGGVLYLTAGGEEEKMNKAKRLLIAAVIGTVVIYGAFAIVSTIVSGYLVSPATNIGPDTATNILNSIK